MVSVALLFPISMTFGCISFTQVLYAEHECQKKDKKDVLTMNISLYISLEVNAKISTFMLNDARTAWR